MFARFLDWPRRHQRLVDLVFMLPLAAMAVISPAFMVARVNGGAHQPVPLAGHIALALAATIPLIWRRRWPRVVFAFVVLTALVQWLFGVGIAAANLAILVAMCTIAVECGIRWALAALVVVETGAGMAVYSMWREEHSAANWNSMIPFSIFIGAIWLAGLYINTRRKYTRSLEERAERLERERDAQVQVAAAAERARIAREMHDVIAHSMSVMVVQADGARYMVDTDTGRAKRAMEAIGTTGRQALSEMRRMLGVLREDGETTLAPQPGVEQLSELVEQVRSAGLAVDVTVEGVPAELSAGLQLTVYRIVQEALTNARKHAGPGATAKVGLYYGDQTLEIRIHDDGRGVVPGDGRGHGLVGMRERVAVYGGSVRAEPAPGGGFRVIARLPVKEQVKT